MILRSTPGFFDLDAWRREHMWLQSQPDDLLGKDQAVLEALDQIEFLERHAQEAATEAA